MREVNEIIIHCSATPPTMDIGIDTIRDWHVNGNGWSDVGYHFVIKRDGTVETGRPIDQAGVHCYGRNSKSIGICMVGGVDEHNKPENNFTSEQFDSLYSWVVYLCQAYYLNEVHGHNEYSDKACPSFDVQDWRKGVGV